MLPDNRPSRISRRDQEVTQDVGYLNAQGTLYCRILVDIGNSLTSLLLPPREQVNEVHFVGFLENPDSDT